MITGRLVFCLGLSQLVGWGTMHYLIAIFGTAIGRDLGWSIALVQGGFSLALVVMGASSGWIGSWINRRGGRMAMMAGCWIGAVGCALLATAQHEAQFYAAWALLGLAMRLALYDAAFAALAHLGGRSSKRAMAQITLFGGLASTVFWPIGQALMTGLGWRGALWAYAAFLLLASCLHFAIPAARVARHETTAEPEAADAPPVEPTDGVVKALYGVIAIIAMFMQTGVAAHFIELLKGMGWTAQAAVGIATLLGIGQFAARSWMVAFGHRFDPVQLNLLPSALLCACWLVGLAFGDVFSGAAAFAFLYGLGNGMATITRGSMPLLLFDPTGYGRIVGAVLKPAFLLAATAPVALALVISEWGRRGMLAIALAMSLALLAASLLLLLRYRARKS